MNKIIAFLKNPWVTWIYLTILLLSVLTIFYSQWDDFLRIVKTSKLKMIVIGMFCHFIVVGVVNPYLHSIAYKKVGSPISFWQAFRIFHLSRIGNYLPGRVWFATNYYLFSKKLNIDTENIAKNFVIINLLLLLTGSICTIPVLSMFGPNIQKILLVFPFLMIILIHPKIFNKIFSFFGINKSGDVFGYFFLIKIAGLYFIAYIILGMSLYFCTLAFQPLDISNLPLMVATVSSFVITMLLAIFAPAGIGVSEGVSVLILSHIIPVHIAVSAVIALRINMIIVDLSCALISAISVAREEKKIVLGTEETISTN